MNDKMHTELFEMYKLHSELAVRIDEAREGLNKVYAGMVTSIVAASILLYRLFPSVDSIWLLPLLGALVSLSWIFSLHSIRGKLTAKHKVLLELENGLSFQFFNKENVQYKEQKFLRRKYTELLLPLGLFLVSIIWLSFLCVKDHPPRLIEQNDAALPIEVCIRELSELTDKSPFPNQSYSLKKIELKLT